MSRQVHRGVFLLTIDTELAWGAVHNGRFARHKKQYDLAREAVVRLLELCARYEIHATWAAVGHLFLKECRPDGNDKHADIVRPRYSWFSGDWFSSDPCSSLEAAPHWYGHDVIARIRRCEVPQEIGCHTFSHIIVGDAGCTRDAIDSELRACRSEAEKVGVNLKSFVFPRNSVGHLGSVRDAGFVAFRGNVASWYGRLPSGLSRIGHLMDNLAPLVPLTALPNKESGLWNLPATYYYPPTDGAWGALPVWLRVLKAKKDIRQAVRRRSLMHMWFHEFNLASDINRLAAGLERIFADVARYRDAGLLDNPTMGELAESLDAKDRQQAERAIYTPSVKP